MVGRLDPTELYSAIGALTLSQQYVEDAVAHVFGVALGGNPERASRIYRVVKGGLAQRQAVSAALSDRPKLQAKWDLLCKRIQLAGEFRGKVVHGRLLTYGGGLIIQLSEDGEPLGSRRLEPPSLQVAKVNPSGDVERFKAAQIRKETASNDQLNRDIALFMDEVRRA